MSHPLQRLIGGSLQRQLAFGVVLIVATLMSYFIWDVNRSQRQMVIEQDRAHILAISHALSTASANALMSRDMSALDELVQGVAGYPDFEYAMVIDVQGQVLAHTDGSRLGQFVSDLPLVHESTLSQFGAGVLDAASPVLLGGRSLGWVRVGTSDKSLQANLSKINQSSLLHLFFVLSVSVLFAVLGSGYVTRRLRAITHVARDIEAGDSKLRVNVEGDDETAHLARQLNNMLDALARRDAALKSSEAFNIAVLNSVAAEVAVLDGDGVILAVNDQWQQFALDNSGALGNDMQALGVGVNYLQVCRAGGGVLDPYAQQAFDGITEVISGHLHTFSMDYPCHSPTQQRWFTLVVRQLGADSVKGVVISHTDISVIKLAEQYEHFRGQVLEMLAGDVGLPDLLLAMVHGVEQLQPGSFCSVLLLSEDGMRIGQCVAPSLPDFYNQAIIGLEIGVGQGSCGTAAATGERVVVADIATHPYWAGFKDLALRAGLAACWSQPVFSSSGKVLGTFAIYHPHVHHPQDADIELIQNVSRLAGIAIDHKNTQNALRTSENVFRTLFETNPFGVVYEDPDGRISAANPAAQRILGLTLDQLQGLTSIDPRWHTIHEDGTDFPGEQYPIALALKTGLPQPGEVMGVASPSGGYVWIIVSAMPLFEDGKLTQAYATFEDITERHLMQQQIRQLAFYDPLTQLPNRRLLTERLSHALTMGKRSGAMGALMFLDLDNFKPLNDAHGHDMGDQLLMEVARRIKTCLRQQDTVARIGGDEFVVMLTDLQSDPAQAALHAHNVAEKIGTSLAEPYVFKTRGINEAESTVEHRCTASIGLTLFSAADSGQENILRRADAAMYQAKEQGRNCVVFAATSSATS